MEKTDAPPVDEPVHYRQVRGNARKHRVWLDTLKHGDVAVLHVGTMQLIFVAGILRAIHKDRTMSVTVSRDLRDMNAWYTDAVKLAVDETSWANRTEAEQSMLDQMEVEPYARSDGGGAVRKGDATPWGYAESVKEITEGIVSCSTQGHGGFWLSPERLREFEAVFPGFKSWAGLPWFEEDCDWAVVAMAFPDEFRDEELYVAAQIIRGTDYMKDVAKRMIGASGFVRAEAFAESHKDHWKVVCSGTSGSGWTVTLRDGFAIALPK